MKKLLLVLLVITLASFLFVGCLPTTPAEGEGEGEGEGEVGICPTVAVTSQVAVGGKNFIKGGLQTITVTFAVPTEPVSVYVGWDLRPNGFPGEEVVMYPNAEKTIYTGEFEFGDENKDCSEAYIYVETCGTCDYCKYPYTVDTVAPTDLVKVTAKGCTCDGSYLIFKSSTTTDDCLGATDCCGDYCSGLASWSINIYDSDPFDTCCDLQCATPVDTCSGAACPVDCTLTKCLTLDKQYYAIFALADNVGNEKKYYAKIKITAEGAAGKASTVEVIPQTSMTVISSTVECPTWNDTATSDSIGVCYVIEIG